MPIKSENDTKRTHFISPKNMVQKRKGGHHMYSYHVNMNIVLIVFLHEVLQILGRIGSVLTPAWIFSEFAPVWAASAQQFIT